MKLLRRDIGIFQAVEPGEGIPRGWGVAWIEPGGWTAICFPYGLHIAARWLRLLYESVRIPRRTWWEKRLLEASDVGYERGVHIGKLLGSTTTIDDKHVFSRSQLNRRIAVAVETAKTIERIPNDEAHALGYRMGQAELMEQREAEAQDASDPKVRPMTNLENVLLDSQAEVGRLEGLLEEGNKLLAALVRAMRALPSESDQALMRRVLQFARKQEAEPDENEAQAKRAESDKYSEELQTEHGRLGKPWDPRGHY